MRVLVIPEDFRKDQFILKPIVSALLRAVARPRANVQVCRDPLLGGIGEALKWDRIAEVIDRYRGMVDLFLLCVDRDGDAGRRERLDQLEQFASDALPSDCLFIAENAWQEIEVWVLAGLDIPSTWSWRDVRAEVNPKERYFQPLAAKRRVAQGPGGGRKALAEQAARRFDRIEQLCPEDIGSMKQHLTDLLP